MVEDLGLDYPVFYGLDCDSTVERLGVYYDEDDQYFHATGFLLKNGTIRHATYSSGPIGRFVADDVYGLVEVYQSQ
jgi:hypothetical protein